MIPNHFIAVLFEADSAYEYGYEPHIIRGVEAEVNIFNYPTFIQDKVYINIEDENSIFCCIKVTQVTHDGGDAGSQKFRVDFTYNNEQHYIIFSATDSGIVEFAIEEYQ